MTRLRLIFWFPVILLCLCGGTKQDMNVIRNLLHLKDSA